MPRIESHSMAGMCGMAIIAVLTLAQELLTQARGTGLAAWWLISLCVPGMVAAHLEWRRGRRDEEAAAGAGLRAGVITAHLAAPLLVALLVIGVITTDWARYAGQVGPEVADAVHGAAWPATVLLGILAVALAYAGCALAGLVGALLYAGLRRVVK